MDNNQTLSYVLYQVVIGMEKNAIRKGVLAIGGAAILMLVFRKVTLELIVGVKGVSYEDALGQSSSCEQTLLILKRFFPNSLYALCCLLCEM